MPLFRVLGFQDFRILGYQVQVSSCSFQRRPFQLTDLDGAESIAEGAEVAGAHSQGAFIRPDSKHRKWITVDGSSGFKAEAGRYHLYVANNCPWCHR
jgi:hypothetical protein